jgi:hypothetical protein
MGPRAGEKNDLSANPFGTGEIDDADRLIWSWCVKEIAFWQGRGIDHEYALQKFTEYNETRPETYLFRIREGQVSMAPKPSTLPTFGILRANHYKEFMQSVVSTLCPELDTTIAIDSGDGGLQPGAQVPALTDDAPVFVFQKLLTSHSLLLPDIDFLLCGFYEHDHPKWKKDYVPYDAKSSSAIFVGTTTGGRPITKEVVNDLARNVVTDRTQPRLRAALYFKNNPNVEFHLPHIHQIDSPETEELLRAIGFGSNVWIPWEDQYPHRFIISMDGNGATCSRVFLALRSNCVPLKYASPHELYYFSGLAPWTHYIPIESDEDVNDIVRIERKHPGYFKHIAEQGQAFANRYLTRSQAMKYTAWLLRQYVSSFGASSTTTWTPGTAAADVRRNAVTTIRILAHIAYRGDVWFERGAWIGEPGKQLEIQGFAVDPGRAFTAADISYQAVLSDGSLSDWCKGGEFCGTRGKSLPIHGLRIRLSEMAARAYVCAYSASFKDGTEVPFVVDGEVCLAESLAPLVGCQIIWTLRDR